MKKIDFLLLASVVSLSLFGIFMIYEASSFVAFKDFGNKYHYLKEQSMWLGLGLFALGFFFFFDYKKLYYLSLPFLIGSILLLLMVFIPGLGVYVMGARRWIDFHFFVVQPSEVIKLTLAIYLSAWFSSKEKGRFWAFILLLGFIVFLVMLQPDMGTTGIIIAEAIVVYFLSGANISHFLLLIPGVSLLGFLLIILEPYRFNRLTTFLNFNQSPDTYSYHVRQILIALGSGGIAGVGIGNSLQKYAYLPENTTDSIFAIIAEEIGFLGSLLLISVFLFFIWRGFMIAINAKDMFGKLLAASITTFIGAQVLINLSAQTALIPLTGVPLPFISYGGSALIINLCSVGILLNISKQSKL
ncbi:putative lipid II flippase FtsW [Patescibacteria group bacterium]|nr:putative lipid II flippase FtsW [Patescibacteria group bacterium]